jgi:hypothetical protein
MWIIAQIIVQIHDSRDSQAKIYPNTHFAQDHRWSRCWHRKYDNCLIGKQHNEASELGILGILGAWCHGGCMENLRFHWETVEQCNSVTSSVQKRWWRTGPTGLGAFSTNSAHGLKLFPTPWAQFPNSAGETVRHCAGKKNGRFSFSARAICKASWVATQSCSVGI